jgi:hypothetical protein
MCIALFSWHISGQVVFILKLFMHLYAYWLKLTHNLDQGLSGYRLCNYFRSLYYYSLFATCFGRTIIFGRTYMH